MIEVEKKFLAEEGDIERITKNAEFIGETINNNTYYDTKDFSLAKADKFLRNRNGNYELKIFIGERGSGVDSYLELEADEEIKKHFRISKNESLKHYLKENDYIPFGSWITKRMKYKIGEFTLDVDSVDFGFDMLEIELMIDDRAKLDKTSEKILNFAKSIGITKSPQNGKAMEFIRRNYPEEYKSILKAWDMLR